MEFLIQFFSNKTAIEASFYAGLFTWSMTALGALCIYFIKGLNRKLFDIMLGLTGGIMLAASFFSLILPAIEMSHGQGFIKVIPVTSGFLLGAFFLYVLDKIIPHIHVHGDMDSPEGVKTKLHGTKLLVLAITLHNIPEGLAVGVLFGSSFLANEVNLMPAIALMIGIGIQNFPEGLAVAIPLRREGFSKFKSFQFGQASALVEPLFSVIGAILVIQMTILLPYILAFAAGAMIYVVVEEVIPEFTCGGNTDLATIGFILGFSIMMMLDVGLS